MMYRWALTILIGIFCGSTLIAQPSGSAKITQVPLSGMYAINIPAELRSISNENLSDLRIYDKQNNEIPFYLIIGGESSIYNIFDSIPFTYKQTKEESKLTFKTNDTLNAIVLKIRNSDINKAYHLSGSNDGKLWFGIINQSQLGQANERSNSYTYKTIGFPKSSYRYFQITLDDKESLPLDIIGVGSWRNSVQKDVLQEVLNENLNISQVPDQKKSLIHFQYNHPQILNQLVFKIDSPAFFKRQARIYTLETREIRSKKKVSYETYENTIKNFELNSSNNNVFNLEQLFVDELFIEIYNQDNPALEIGLVQFFQFPVQLIVPLKTDESYTVKTGFRDLQAPQYDIAYFANQLNNNIKFTTLYDLKQEVIAAPTHIETKKSLWQQTWFMWVCISIGALVVFYFTGSLLKDMN